MDTVLKNFLILAVVSSCTCCEELTVNYNARSVAGAGAGMCPDTQGVVERVRQDIDSLISSYVLPALRAGPGYGACGCGGPGWRRAAYLNMSDPTQTCPPAWELITTPRRSCARRSNATSRSCYSAVFPTRDYPYSQVCGRIIGYQFGLTQAFVLENINPSQPIDGPYVAGVSLTYGDPRQHIWTFANAIDEVTISPSRCPCIISFPPYTVPSFIGNDYFCETGVPPGQRHAITFYPDDPLWDGQGCSPTSTCECTLNNPPWLCKQLPQSTNADLEVRLCAVNLVSIENTLVQLIEIYTK